MDENKLLYKDYFPLVALNRFGVSPERDLNLRASGSDILSPFGELSGVDYDYLNHKLDVARTDAEVGLCEQKPTKALMEIPELEEDLEQGYEEPIEENPHPRDATLNL